MSTDCIAIFRGCPGPAYGLNNGPFLIQKLAKTSQNNAYHFQFLSSTFWRIFHENPIKKIPILQMHENLHKNVNENIFSHFQAIFHEFLWCAHTAS